MSDWIGLVIWGCMIWDTQFGEGATAMVEEILPNSPVKQVIFQIRFPNLFFLESKIGDLQLEIMREFPESLLLMQQSFIIAELPIGRTIEEPAPPVKSQPTTKFWQFRSPKKYVLNVHTNSLDITSEHHRSYDRPEAEHRFRDIVGYVMTPFLELTKLPLINRIGLRYVNECAVPSKDSHTFREHYNTSFPLERFRLEDSDTLAFRAVVNRGELKLGYLESFKSENGGHKLIIDLDAFSLDIDPATHMEVTDRLHNLINNEFSQTVGQRALELMRAGREP